LTQHLNELLKPIQAEYTASPEWQEIALQAYPPEKAAVKVKKVKDKGDPEKRAAAAAARKAAAAAAVVAQPDGHVEGKDAQKVNVGPSTDEMLKKLNIAG
jgi:tyrosyl-tRNA synthetase